MSLHTKYRPRTFEDVVGQAGAVKSLQKMINQKSCRAMVLTGPSGVGKTTIARIVARAVGCGERNITEIDAATYSGIDAMRAITDTLVYKPLHGENGKRMVIIDEAHALSKSAWQALLKSVEEPPPHIWWAFCSTEPSKIPATIRTRCACYDLKPVDSDSIYKLLRRVEKKEHLGVTDDVLHYIAEQSDGSPRRALTYMAQAAGCTSEKAAAAVLSKAQEDADGAAIRLARELLGGRAQWTKMMRIIADEPSANAEGIRITVLAYMTKVAMSAKTENRAGPVLDIMDAFSEPCNPNDGMAPIILAIGRVIFGT